MDKDIYIKPTDRASNEKLWLLEQFGVIQRFKSELGFKVDDYYIYCVDVDTYHNESLEQLNHELMDIENVVYQRTKRGGLHFFFRSKAQIGCPKEFDTLSINIKGQYGYVLLYEDFIKDETTKEKVFDKYPVFEFEDLRSIIKSFKDRSYKKEQGGYGPCRNNNAIAQNFYTEGLKGNITGFTNELISLVQANKGRSDFDSKKHIEDAVTVYTKGVISSIYNESIDPGPQHPINIHNNFNHSIAGQTKEEDQIEGLMTQEKKQQPTEWILDQYIPRKWVTIIKGTGGAGKTHFMYWLVKFFLEAGLKVMYGNSEGEYSQGINIFLYKWKLIQSVGNNLIFMNSDKFDFMKTDEYTKSLTNLIEYQKPDAIIEDCLYDVIENPNDNTQVKDFFSKTKPILQQNNIAHVFALGNRKSQANLGNFDATDKLMGARAFVNKAKSILDVSNRSRK